MTKPVTESVLAAGALALVVTITRVGPAQRAPVAAAAHSPAPASECSVRDDGDALALVPPCRPPGRRLGLRRRRRER